MTFQVNDIPEWGTLDKNLDQVQAIDQWFQGRFLLLFVTPTWELKIQRNKVEYIFLMVIASIV